MMSTCQSRFVSPAAAKPNVTEPSLLSSHPTVRSPPLAAATVEVMPLVPFQLPSPMPVTIAATMLPAESPVATVIIPVPTSTLPPAFGTRPPTVVCKAFATATVPPASGTRMLEASADACVSRRLPACTAVEPVSVLAWSSTRVPAPAFISGKGPESTG